MKLTDPQKRKIEVVVAIYAAVLATASFGWQVIESVRNRPVLQIGDKRQVYKVQTFGPGHKSPVELRLETPLMNVGSKVLTVYDLSPYVDIRNPDGTPGPFEFAGMEYEPGRLPIRLGEGEVGAWSGVIQLKSKIGDIPDDAKFKATVVFSVITTAGVFSHQEEIELRYVEFLRRKP